MTTWAEIKKDIEKFGITDETTCKAIVAILPVENKDNKIASSFVSGTFSSGMLALERFVIEFLKSDK